MGFVLVYALPHQLLAVLDVDALLCVPDATPLEVVDELRVESLKLGVGDARWDVVDNVELVPLRIDAIDFRAA